MSITKLSPNWACQMGPIHLINFLLSGTSSSIFLSSRLESHRRPTLPCFVTTTSNVYLVLGLRSATTSTMLATAFGPFSEMALHMILLALRRNTSPMAHLLMLLLLLLLLLAGALRLALFLPLCRSIYRQYCCVCSVVAMFHISVRDLQDDDSDGSVVRKHRKRQSVLRRTDGHLESNVLALFRRRQAYPV